MLSEDPDFLDADISLTPHERLLLDMSDRWGDPWTAVFFTFISITMSEMTALFLLVVVLGRPLSESGIHFALSFVIPACVTPPLFLVATQFVRRARELTERHTALVSRYRALAERDQLTGVLNRRGLFNLEEEIVTGTVLGLIDLDRFKEVNDQYGHNVGDQALLMVSAKLNEIAGPSGVVARAGGDEFVVLRPPTVGDATPSVPGRLEVFVTDELTVTMTIGSSRFADGDCLDRVIQRADVRMYSGKRSRSTRRRAPSRAAGASDGQGHSGDWTTHEGGVPADQGA